MSNFKLSRFEEIHSFAVRGLVEDAAGALQHYKLPIPVTDIEMLKKLPKLIEQVIKVEEVKVAEEKKRLADKEAAIEKARKVAEDKAKEEAKEADESEE